VNPSLGNAPYGFAWSANAATGNVNAATGLSADTYTISITSADGCEKDTTITIVAPPAAISIQGVVVNTLACHETTGTIGTVLVSGGTAPYNYVYAPQSNLSATTTIPALPFAGVAIGDYVLTVSDNFGCSDTFWFSVTRQDLFLNPVQASPESCTGASNGVINNAVPFYGTAPYQLGYAPIATPSTITAVAGFPVNGMAPGTYIMYATDSKGCTDSSWFTIGAGSIACCTHSISATLTPPTCAGNDGAIDMTTTGALGVITYTWGGGETNEDLTGLASGTYYVTVTDDITNCSKDTSFVLLPPTPPSVDAGLDVTLTCVLLNTNLTATSTTPSVSFAWSNGTNAASTLVSTANTYNVTATDPSNGCTASDAVVVTLDNAIPNVNAGADILLTCVITNTSLQATSTTAGVTYAWSNGINTADNLVSSPNVYTVTATNPSNGCTISDAVDVTQNISTPNVDAGLDQELSCTTSSANLTGASSTSGVSYAWSGPGTITNGNTAIATVNVSGNYSLLVTDPSNGCTASDVVVVTPNVNSPNINAGLDQVLTCATTSVSLTATSSTAGVTFLWSDGTTNASTNVNAPTTYSVTATDPNNGCQAVDQVVVNQNIAAPDVNAGADATLTCLITSISLNATSTISGATFVWSNGTANATTTVNAPNIYTVTATDPSNGCTASDDVMINANGVPVLSIVSGDNPCPDVAKGYVNTNVSGGIGPYTYVWSNGATSPSLKGLHGGTYHVTVTDANGCSLNQTVQIIEGDSLSITNLTSVQIPLGETIQLNPIVNGANAPLSYSWNPAVYLSCSNCSNPTVNSVNSISYGLLVVDTNGCKAESQVSITVVPDYQIYIPSAFTPNNDGTNDVFEIFGNKKLWKELSMTIFNRWGEKVFESSDSKFAWDGTFHGVLQNPQIYVYQLRITFIDGYAMPLQKGSISLIR
jgi:gliding motility-associated-like protein